MAMALPAGRLWVAAAAAVRNSRPASCNTVLFGQTPERNPFPNLQEFLTGSVLLLFVHSYRPPTKRRNLMTSNLSLFGLSLTVGAT
jgi:hypothetical protein